MSVIAKVLTLACVLGAGTSPQTGGKSEFLCTNDVYYRACQTAIGKCGSDTCSVNCLCCKGRGPPECCNCSVSDTTPTSTITLAASGTKSQTDYLTAFYTTTSSFTTTSSNSTTALNATTSSNSVTRSDTTTSLTTTIHSSSTTINAAGTYDAQVVPVVVSVALAVGVVSGALLVLVWWRRIRASKSREGAKNVHTNTRISTIDGVSHIDTVNELSTRRKATQNGAAASSNNRNSEHVYTHIDSVTNLRAKSTTEGAEDSEYNEPDEVANRKFPTVPAQDKPYYLAHNSSAEHYGRQQQLAALPSVYSLAHNPNDNTEKPQYSIFEGEKKNAFQFKGNGGQYFILEEGAATDENVNKMVTRGQNDASIHDAHEYSPLDASDRAQSSAVGDAEYTPLNSKTGLRPKIPAKIHDEQEYSDLDPSSRTRESAGRGAEYTALEHNITPVCMKGIGKHIQAFPRRPSDGQNKGGQYFVLEKEGENDDNGDAVGGQYFVLKKDAAKDEHNYETRGYYFVLEEDIADTEDKDQKQNGQYFVLEKEATDEDKEVKVGQYFVLEKDAENANESKQDSPYLVLGEDVTDSSKINPLVHAVTGTANGTESDIRKGIKENGTPLGGQRGSAGNHPSATAADEEYSHLDRSGKGGKSGKKADTDKDYTHLDVTPNSDSNEEAARNAKEYFKLEPEK